MVAAVVVAPSFWSHLHQRNDDDDDDDDDDEPYDDDDDEKDEAGEKDGAGPAFALPPDTGRFFDDTGVEFII